MKKILSSAILFLFLFLKCNSQSDFRKGFVILNNNDTIFGSIKYIINNTKVTECVFVNETELKTTTYHPEDIKAFRFADGKYYISRFIKTGDSEKKFLEFLFDGIVDLYSYYDNHVGHYLISKNNSDLTVLKIKKDTKIINNITYVKESNEYIAVLKTFFNDSPVAMQKAENTFLNANSLIKISEDYHNEVCPNEACITYAKKKTRSELRFGSILGLSSSKMTYPDLEHFDLPSRGTGITYGLFLNLKDPSISEKLSIQLETIFTKTRFSSDISNLDFLDIKIPVIIKYTFPFRKVQPSALLGVIYGNILSFKHYSKNSVPLNQLLGRGQYGLTAALETAYMFNSGRNVFFQLRYEYLQGHHHYWIQDVAKWYFFTNLNNINFTAGFKF